MLLEVAAARRCVGARFRLHGRTIETGLDCVGVAAIAFGVSAVPAGYALRGGRVEDVLAAIDAAGLLRGDGEPDAGALMLLLGGPFQLHLAIRTDLGFVHADAALRRVTEVPGMPEWPLLAHWRAASPFPPSRERVG
jgi:hypothetical protein